MATIQVYQMAKAVNIVNAGTGGTPGAVVIVGTTGTGLKFSANGTINAAGQLSAIGTIITGGQYTAPPTNPFVEPITGASLSGATVNLTMEEAYDYPRLPSYTVATLPAASAGLQGECAFVTDANATFTVGIGAAVAAGGANVVPVFCDGTTWRIG